MQPADRALEQEVLALIPARGGSKGIPRKNVLPILGKPVIAYTIEQALQSRHITRVVVSTDDAEIAAVAVEYGAEVPFIRPRQFAGDLSPDIDAFRHALAALKQQENYHCDYVVHLRPPTVLRSVADIDEAIEMLAVDPQADTLRSVNSARLTPFKMWIPNGQYMDPLLTHQQFGEPQSMPRQLLPQYYWQNGYVDVIRSDVIENGRMCGERVIPFVVDKEIMELDYIEDVELLEKYIGQHGLEVESRGRPAERRHAV